MPAIPGSPISDVAGLLAACAALLTTLAVLIKHRRETARLVAQQQERLRASERRFRALVQNSNDIVAVMKRDGTVEYVSPAIETFFGYRPEELEGGPATHFIHADDVDVARERFATAVTSGAALPPFEVRMQHKHGHWRWIEVSVTNLLHEPGVEGLVVNHRDVTERKRAEDLRKRTEAQYRDLVERVPAIVYEAGFGPDAEWTYVSPQIHSILGFTPEEWMADPLMWARQLHPDDRSRVVSLEAQSLTAGFEGPLAVDEYRLIARDGRIVWVSDEATVVRNERGEPVCFSGVLFDITDRKLLQEQLEHQAFHDALTGLANRPLFADRLEHALERARRNDELVAVLFLDIDDFKTVNDSLGHASGDQLLRAVAGRLHRVLRASDTAARLGGDEFAVLLEATSENRASQVAERIFEELREPFLVEGKAIGVRVSIGIVLGGRAGDSGDELLRNADVAMYKAKSRGKARYEVFHPHMHSRLVDRLELQSDLQHAVEGRELTVHYQPFIDLATGRITGVEALCRWNHPQRGPVAPAEFIPIAEDSGLIVRLGDLVRRIACGQAAAWNARRPANEALNLSVNISAKTLQHPDFVAQLADALRETSLAGSCLILEITESALMHDVDAVIKKLQCIKALGVRIAVDDFGTGFSSLNYLRRFPVDILKIDRSFVEGVARGPEEAAFSKAILALGRTLRLETLAEGIEHWEQVRVLRDLNCDLGQGFYFARPADAAAIGPLLERGTVGMDAVAAGAAS